MNEQKIWDRLTSAGMTAAGAAGMMGNLYAESALNPQNLQNSYEKSLGYSDESYTAAVDSGKYAGFVRDSAGYGLAQWTFWSRKQALLNFARSRNASIGDLDMQLDFLIKELQEDYPAVWTCLCSASDVKTASDTVMAQFERPADVSASAKSKRAEYSQKYYSMFALTNNEVTKMTKYGIDVSKHNGSIDWQKVKASGKVDFAILRAGYGKLISQKDVKFEEYYSGAKSAGIPVGAYWYSYAVSEDEARQEANVFLEAIKRKQFEYPVYFDMEEPSQLKLGKAKCSEIAEAFLKTIEKAGYFVGLYMSKSHLETYITEEVRNRYAIWVAHYGVSQTSYSGQFGMWQKSDTGTISGISGNVDLDECYIDYPSVIRNAGLNGFAKPDSETVEVPAETEPKNTIEAAISIDGKNYSGMLKETGKD